MQMNKSLVQCFILSSFVFLYWEEAIYEFVFVAELKNLHETDMQTQRKWIERQELQDVLTFFCVVSFLSETSERKIVPNIERRQKVWFQSQFFFTLPEKEVQFLRNISIRPWDSIQIHTFSAYSLFFYSRHNLIF